MQPFIFAFVTKNEKRPRGRPPTGKLRVLLKLTPEADKLLYREAGKERITKSEFVERAIRERVEQLKLNGEMKSRLPSGGK
jgi:hypothetical protein